MVLQHGAKENIEMSKFIQRIENDNNVPVTRDVFTLASEYFRKEFRRETSTLGMNCDTCATNHSIPALRYPRMRQKLLENICIVAVSLRTTKIRGHVTALEELSSEIWLLRNNNRCLDDPLKPSPRVK